MANHRCRARPVWAGFRNHLFVVDALVEACNDPDVPQGTPFSLHLVAPVHPDDYLFGRLRTSIENGHPFNVEVRNGTAVLRARLSARGWARVFEVDEATGWPRH